MGRNFRDISAKRDLLSAMSVYLVYVIIRLTQPML